jgi:dolichol-phosphate mannosyltransferase
MFVLALMGEYIGRLYNEAKRRPLYIIQEIAGRAEESPGRLGVVARPKALAQAPRRRSPRS